MQSLQTMIRRHAAGEVGEMILSQWLAVDQARITAFGKDTLDPDPLHIDPEYAARLGPYGKTIAFGFLTISLLTYFYRQSLHDDISGYALNYGFNRLRLPQVVTVGSRIRGEFRLIGIEERGPGKILLRNDVTVAIEGEAKPALAAEWLSMWIDDGITRRD